MSHLLNVLWTIALVLRCLGSGHYLWGGGWLQNGRGGASEVLPLQNWGGEAEKVLAMLKGGQVKFWGSFDVVA